MDESRGLLTGELRDHSTDRVPVVSPSQSAAEARRYMVGKAFDFVDEIVVLDQGIPIVPDLLANAGGVTVSYFEWAQDQQRYSWQADEIAARLRSHLEAAMERIAEAAERFDVGWRQAGQAVAIARVAEAARLRSVYP